MKNMDMTNYSIKVLYDNGKEETYKSGDVAKEKIDEIANIIMTALRTGSNGYLQFPNEQGLSIFIDLSKVSRVEFLNESGCENE